jgi:CheY-like chemotaxis protein
MRGKTILAVDDDQDILDMIETVVTGAKATFLGVATAEACLESLKQAEPHMLILDVNLEDKDGMNGIELLARIRKDFPKLKSRVMFLTAQKSMDLIEKVEELGYNGFLFKPIDPYRLIERIAKQFSHPSGEEI